MFERLIEHYDPQHVYTSGVKHKYAIEYRTRIINTITPFWKHGSVGDFHKSVANVLATHHRKQAMKKNADKRLKGEANQWDPNLAPNE
jgi:hypothetical protein